MACVFFLKDGKDGHCEVLLRLFFLRFFLTFLKRELRKTELIRENVPVFESASKNYLIFWEVDGSLSRDRPICFQSATSPGSL